jgi:two-component SAPR family response regulator
VDDALFPITSPKPKELLALLVDRAGGTVASGLAITLLWEDKPDDDNTKALYRMTLKRLREILAAGGIDFILSAEGPAKHVRPETFTCDYLRFLSGDREAVAKYNGEYMSEYSWAEETNARLTNLKESRGARG